MILKVLSAKKFEAYKCRMSPRVASARPYGLRSYNRFDKLNQTEMKLLLRTLRPTLSLNSFHLLFEEGGHEN
jgi:hypothetical protein